MGFWDDMQGTLFGGASGAATGGMIGGVPGAVIGGGLGAFGGYMGSHGAGQAADAQRSALDDAMKRLQAFGAQHYQNRMDDLNKTMSFYGPADSYLHSIYSQPTSPQMPPESVPTRARIPVRSQ